MDFKFDQISKLRVKTPLIEAITNYITINDCANAIIALGASPAMCESADEAYDFSLISNSVYINIGTLTKEQEHAMIQAIKAAYDKNLPLVLDPVGCAAIPRRIGFLNKLRKFGNIAVVRGNMGEIKALTDKDGKVRGVDSIDDGSDGIKVCKTLANEWNCIVAASGKTDIITDGEKTVLIKNGTGMLTKITGAGCVLGAITAAFCGAETNHLSATIAGHLTMSIAGEIAANKEKGNSPGSFKVNLFDQFYVINDKILKYNANMKFL